MSTAPRKRKRRDVPALADANEEPESFPRGGSLKAAPDAATAPAPKPVRNALHVLRAPCGLPRCGIVTI